MDSRLRGNDEQTRWIPAFAGMTTVGSPGDRGEGHRLDRPGGVRLNSEPMNRMLAATTTTTTTPHNVRSRTVAR
jgi:hypothetical protein